MRRNSLPALSFTAVVAACSVGLLVVSAGTARAATAVPLGTTAGFVVLAGAGITNTGATTLNGDIGTFPTTSITGTATMTVNGTNHAGDGVTQGAKADLVTAYDNARDQEPRIPIVDDLAGDTLTPGVYNSASSIGLTGALTLNGEGNADAVFIFQAGSTLTTGPGSSVNLINGADACNVFWQVGSSATLNSGTAFRGTILALTDIHLRTGTTIIGRALARNGEVTLQNNTITRPTCTSPDATSAPTGSTGPSTTPTGDTEPTDGEGSGEGTTGTSGGGSGGGTPTSGQITQTPRGPVDTGDAGSGGRTGSTPFVLAGAALLGGVAGATALSARRRRAAA